MVGKIRMSRKATKGKGKLWKKGHSSSFNPEYRKNRDEAKRRALYGNQGEGHLTKQALVQHNVLHGNQSVESGDEGNDAMSIGDQTFVTTFTECSNPAFGRLMKNWKSGSLLHKEMLAVLAAVTEVIKSMGGKETETEYFAALMTTLTAVDNDEAVSAVATLLYMVVKKLPVSVLRLKFSDSCKTFIDLLSKHMNSDYNALLRNLLGCLQHFLRALEPGEWNDSTSKIFSVLLEFTTHQKPKVRKMAHDVVSSILCGSKKDEENSNATHPAALPTAKFCISNLELSKGQASPLTFHVLGLMKDVIGHFSKTSVKASSEMVLRIMTLSDSMVSSVCLKVFSGLFTSRMISNNLPPDLNGKLVLALYDFQPNINDVLPAVEWLFVMEKALICLYGSNEEMCLNHLPKFFTAAVKCWKSDNSEVRLAVTQSLNGVLDSCMDSSKPEYQRFVMANPNSNPMSKAFQMVESALSYQYHLAWKEVLVVIGTFFNIAGKHLYPVMIKCLQSLADLRDSYKFSHIAELDKAIGMAIHRMGSKVVLQAIPLQIGGENDKLDFPRSWMLPLLRDNVKDTELAFFAKYFLPLAVKVRNKVLQLEKENKAIESKMYSVIWTQIWSCLPGFCTNPTDLKHAFKDIAKILGTALTEEPELRTYILAGLRLLITNNLENEENKMEMSRYAKNYLPILFNIYTTEPKDKFEERHRLAAYDSIKVYLQITDEMQVGAFFQKSLEKLKDPEIDVFKQHSLLDLSRAMMIYVEMQHIEELYQYCKPLLKHTNHTIQKKAYSVLRELCASTSKNCVVFVIMNLETLKEVLITSLSTSAPSCKALRINCIEHIIQQLGPENMEFIASVVPEAVLCTKENSAKARKSAYSLLVQIGHTLRRWNPKNAEGALRDYMQMLLAGLAGSPHVVSATILAIGQVMYEFREDLDSDLLSLLIENMCLLLTSRSREVVMSALSFVKALFASVDKLKLAQHVQNLIENITSISEDHQRHFRFKAKQLFTRLIRIFGYEMIYKMVPESFQKQLANIRKLEARKERTRNLKNDMSDEESGHEGPSHKGKSDLIEDLLEDSDEEIAEESATKKPRKILKRSRKQASAPWIEEQGENDIVDLLDPSVNRRILGTKPQKEEDKNKLSKIFPIAPDGRLIIKDDEEEEVKASKRKATKASDKDTPDEGFSMETETKKRKLEDLSDDENVASKYQTGGKGIHRNMNKDSSKKMAGTEYKAKKAGGDIKKGKYEPFAYYPLNKQVLNKRKRGKLDGQFKGIVKAAKRGAQKGTKTKVKSNKRRK